MNRVCNGLVFTVRSCTRDALEVTSHGEGTSTRSRYAWWLRFDIMPACLASCICMYMLHGLCIKTVKRGKVNVFGGLVKDGPRARMEAREIDGCGSFPSSLGLWPTLYCRYFTPGKTGRGEA